MLVLVLVPHTLYVGTGFSASHTLPSSPCTQEFGPLGTAFLSPPSLSSLANVGLDIVRSKENFRLKEAELQWVVSKLRQIRPELLEPVMNLITSLTYCSHPATKVLTSDLSTEVFHDILKVGLVRV